MSQLDDEFDLDIRITPLGRTLTRELRAADETGGWECYSVDPSCGATCACNTSETCNQQLEDCGFPFTFPGNYCEDQSDGCAPDGTSTCDCADPPDVDPPDPPHPPGH